MMKEKTVDPSIAVAEGMEEVEYEGNHRRCDQRRHGSGRWRNRARVRKVEPIFDHIPRHQEIVAHQSIQILGFWRGIMNPLHAWCEGFTHVNLPIFILPFIPPTLVWETRIHNRTLQLNQSRLGKEIPVPGLLQKVDEFLGTLLIRCLVLDLVTALAFLRI